MQLVTYRHSPSESEAAQELSHQANILTVYLYQHGHVLLDDFRDIGRRGDGLAVALDVLEAGRAEGLLVTALDQIGGSTGEVRAVASTLRSIDAVLVTVSDGIIDLENLFYQSAPSVALAT